jgi:hypothetical protein
MTPFLEPNTLYNMHMVLERVKKREKGLVNIGTPRAFNKIFIPS